MREAFASWREQQCVGRQCVGARQQRTFGSMCLPALTISLVRSLGETFVTAQPLGRVLLKTILRSAFSQAVVMSSCDWKSLLYSAFTCSTLVMPASSPPLNIFLTRIGRIVTRSLPVFLESLSYDILRGRAACTRMSGAAAQRPGSEESEPGTWVVSVALLWSVSNEGAISELSPSACRFSVC